MGVFAEFERSYHPGACARGPWRGPGARASRLGRPTLPAELENAIRAALNRPGRTEGVRKIAARLGLLRVQCSRLAALSRAQARSHNEASLTWYWWPGMNPYVLVVCAIAPDLGAGLLDMFAPFRKQE